MTSLRSSVWSIHQAFGGASRALQITLHELSNSFLLCFGWQLRQFWSTTTNGRITQAPVARSGITNCYMYIQRSELSMTIRVEKIWILYRVCGRVMLLPSLLFLITCVHVLLALARISTRYTKMFYPTFIILIHKKYLISISTDSWASKN